MKPARSAPNRLRRRWVAPLIALGLLASPLATGQTCAPIGMASAQSPFSSAVIVNDQSITHYEVDHRARFLEFVGAGRGGDLRDQAREGLIDNRLQRQEAQRLGLRAGREDIHEAMNEFAARGDLTANQLIDRLRDAGIDPDTFRDFIHAGLLWRELVNARYGPQLRITEAQIDQALSVAAVQPVTEIRIAEIFLPADERFAEQVRPLIPRIQQISSTEEFGQAARQVSAAPSREQGGRVDRWIPLREAPGPIAEAFGEASVGTIIGPIDFPGAYAFFQLLARRDTRDVPRGQTEYDFRRIGLPGGRSPENEARLAQIRASVDGCADMGPVVARVAPELPDGAVASISRPHDQIDSATAAELGRMNPGQVSGNLVQSGELVVLMLCNRRVVAEAPPSRARVRQMLMNRALEDQAQLYLQQLRGEAEIRRP